MNNKKTVIKEKALPFVAGAAVTAGAVVAKSLTNAKTRKKVAGGLEKAKKEALSTIDEVTGRGEEMVKHSDHNSGKRLAGKAKTSGR